MGPHPGRDTLPSWSYSLTDTLTVTDTGTIETQNVSQVHTFGMQEETGVVFDETWWDCRNATQPRIKFFFHQHCDKTHRTRTCCTWNVLWGVGVGALWLGVRNLSWKLCNTGCVSLPLSPSLFSFETPRLDVQRVSESFHSVDTLKWFYLLIYSESARLNWWNWCLYHRPSQRLYGTNVMCESPQVCSGMHRCFPISRGPITLRATTYHPLTDTH